MFLSADYDEGDDDEEEEEEEDEVIMMMIMMMMWQKKMMARAPMWLHFRIPLVILLKAHVKLNKCFVYGLLWSLTNSFVP